MKKQYIHLVVTFMLAFVSQLSTAQINETVAKPVTWPVFSPEEVDIDQHVAEYALPGLPHAAGNLVANNLTYFFPDVTNPNFIVEVRDTNNNLLNTYMWNETVKDEGLNLFYAAPLAYDSVHWMYLELQTFEEHNLFYSSEGVLVYIKNLDTGLTVGGDIILKNNLSAKDLNNCTDTDLINGVCVQINWSSRAYTDLQNRELALRQAAATQLNNWFNAQKPEIEKAIENKYNKNFSSFSSAKDYHFEQVSVNQANLVVNHYMGGEKNTHNNIELTTTPKLNLRSSLEYNNSYFINLRHTFGRLSDMNISSSILENELVKFYQGVNAYDSNEYRDYLIKYMNIREGVANEARGHLENKYDSSSKYNKITFLAETIQYDDNIRIAVENHNIAFTTNEILGFLESYRKKKSVTYKHTENALDILNLPSFLTGSLREQFAQEVDDYIDNLIIFNNDFTKSFENFTDPTYKTDENMEYYRKNMYNLIEDLNGDYQSLIGNLDPDAVVPLIYDLYERKRELYYLSTYDYYIENNIPFSPLHDVLYNSNYPNFTAFEDVIKYDLPLLLEELGNKKVLDNLFDSQSFESAFEVLKTASIATVNKKEIVYLGAGAGSSITYTKAGESAINGGTVNFTKFPNMSSFFHNHYAGGTAGQGNLLSTFSNQDVVEFFSIAAYNLMDDPDDFTMLLVTPFQDLQAVMINNQENFNAKIAELTAGDATDPNVTIGGKTLLEFRLDQLLNELASDFNTEIIEPGMNSNTSGAKLNKIIKKYGLAVYQFNTTFQKWLKQ